MTRKLGPIVGVFGSLVMAWNLGMGDPNRLIEICAAITLLAVAIRDALELAFPEGKRR